MVQNPLEESKEPLAHARNIHAEFLAFKEKVTVREFHHAMTVFQYYIKCGFDKTKYPAGMEEDPVVEIAKSLKSNKIKAFFVADVEFEVMMDAFLGHLQAEVMVFPPYYLPMKQFKTIMEEHSQ